MRAQIRPVLPAADFSTSKHIFYFWIYLNVSPAIWNCIRFVCNFELYAFRLQFGIINDLSAIWNYKSFACNLELYTFRLQFGIIRFRLEFGIINDSSAIWIYIFCLLLEVLDIRNIYRVTWGIVQRISRTWQPVNRALIHSTVKSMINVAIPTSPKFTVRRQIGMLIGNRVSIRLHFEIRITVNLTGDVYI